jgi:hypothetical protein
MFVTLSVLHDNVIVQCYHNIIMFYERYDMITLSCFSDNMTMTMK